MNEHYMKKAIALAKEAEGFTSPNPMVGAVVVKEGQIVGEGYHAHAGEAHAEVVALAQAGDKAIGATLYVTLEPCAHYGKTPPCAKRVVEAGIDHVVIGCLDPNPLVAGKGIQILKDAGIEVTVGVCEEACKRLNEAFFYYIQTHRPFVTLKTAMSFDGAIATRTGDSQWITNEEARKDGHYLRSIHDVILCGIGTVLSDDPQLTCRLEDKCYHQPDVVVLDAQGRTPSNAKLFGHKNRNVYIMVAPTCPIAEKERLSAVGASVIELPLEEYGLSIPALLDELGQREYISILVEGGGTVIASFVETQSFHKIIAYMGNLIIGGTEATRAFGGLGAATLKEATKLDIRHLERLGENIRMEIYPAERKHTHVHRHC